jgi:hypothetical protein
VSVYADLIIDVILIIASILLVVIIFIFTSPGDIDASEVQAKVSREDLRTHSMAKTYLRKYKGRSFDESNTTFNYLSNYFALNNTEGNFSTLEREYP